MRILATSDLHVPELLLGMCTYCLKFRYPIDDVDRQRVSIDFILDRQFHRRVDVAAFLISANVKVPVIGPVIGEPVNQPGIAVEVEDDRFVDSKQAIKIAIAQAVWMVTIRLHLEQIDHIDEANLQFRKLRRAVMQLRPMLPALEYHRRKPSRRQAPALDRCWPVPRY